MEDSIYCKAEKSGELDGGGGSNKNLSSWQPHTAVGEG